MHIHRSCSLKRCFALRERTKTHSWIEESETKNEHLINAFVSFSFILLQY